MVFLILFIICILFFFGSIALASFLSKVVLSFLLIFFFIMMIIMYALYRAYEVATNFIKKLSITNGRYIAKDKTEATSDYIITLNKLDDDKVNIILYDNKLKVNKGDVVLTYDKLPYNLTGASNSNGLYIISIADDIIILENRNDSVKTEYKYVILN